MLIIEICHGPERAGGYTIGCAVGYAPNNECDQHIVCNTCGRPVSDDFPPSYGCHYDPSVIAWLREAPMPEPPPIVRAPKSVYFAQAPNGEIKIGTSCEVPRRLASLGYTLRVRLRLLATTPGAYSREREMHARFAACHLHGEWFAPAPELLAFIETLKNATERAA